MTGGEQKPECNFCGQEGRSLSIATDSMNTRVIYTFTDLDLTVVECPTLIQNASFRH